MGDFNVTMDDKFMTGFCKFNNLSSLIDKLTCCKNFDKPTCIELIITNKPSYFQPSNVLRMVFRNFTC